MFWHLLSGRCMPVAEWNASGYDLEYVFEVAPFLSWLRSPFTKQPLVIIWLPAHTCSQERACLSVNTGVLST